MRAPCQRNHPESETRKAGDERMDDPVSTIANAILAVTSVSREAKLASIHCGKPMVTASLPVFVATHI
jgi:hypothetical protein